MEGDSRMSTEQQVVWLAFGGHWGDVGGGMLGAYQTAEGAQQSVYSLFGIHEAQWGDSSGDDDVDVLVVPGSRRELWLDAAAVEELTTRPGEVIFGVVVEVVVQ